MEQWAEGTGLLGIALKIVHKKILGMQSLHTQDYVRALSWKEVSV